MDPLGKPSIIMLLHPSMYLDTDYFWKGLLNNDPLFGINDSVRNFSQMEMLIEYRYFIISLGPFTETSSNFQLEYFSMRI